MNRHYLPTEFKMWYRELVERAFKPELRLNVDAQAFGITLTGYRKTGVQPTVQLEMAKAGLSAREVKWDWEEIHKKKKKDVKQEVCYRQCYWETRSCH